MGSKDWLQNLPECCIAGSNSYWNNSLKIHILANILFLNNYVVKSKDYHMSMSKLRTCVFKTIVLIKDLLISVRSCNLKFATGYK